MAKNVCEKTIKRAIALTSILFTLASCAHTDHGDEQKARTETTVVAALACALVAGGTTYAITHKKGDSVAVASVAGILCGIAAYTYANRMIKYRNELVDREKSLEKQIKLGQYANFLARKRNTKLEVDMTKLATEIDLLASDVKQDLIGQQELAQNIKALEEQIVNLQNDVMEAQKDLTELETFRNGMSTTSEKLDKEIEELTASLDRLRRNTTELVAMRQRLP